MKTLRSLIIAACVAAAAVAWAVPAKQGAMVFAQPDGSQITLSLGGDEYCHYFLTDDYQMVLRNADGEFCFATVNDEGCLVPSAIRAANIADRNDAQARFVNSLSRTAIEDAISRTKRLSPIFAKQQEAAEGPEGMSRASGSNSSGVGRFSNKSDYPTEGDIRGLCVLVEYTDKKFMNSDDDTYDYFHSMLNEQGFSEQGATGSAWDYFQDASKGKFNPTFDVAGPVTLPHPRAYYGGNSAVSGNDKNATQMITHALDILISQGFDFSPYDNDGDHVIDNVFVFYAGEGEAQSGVAEAVWPHQYQLRYLYGEPGYSLGNGYYADSYACSSECCDQYGQKLDGIGTFVHEFSHVLGLPDLYNTQDPYAGYTPSDYSVLDQGPYNNNSRTPPTYSTFERNALKWIELEDLTEDTAFTLNDLQASNHGFILPTSSRFEFFLFENRQKQGWDSYIPYHGMLVWHIHALTFIWNRNEVNNNPDHQYVDLIEAGRRTSATNAFIKRSYPFPGYGKVTSLDSDRLKTWGDVDLGISLSNITEVDGVIKAWINGKDNNSGIGSIVGDAAIGVNVNGREVTIEGADAKGVAIVDAQGRTVSKGASRAVLAPGLYIVYTAQGSQKILVR